MEVNITEENGVSIVAILGDLDTNTSPSLDSKISTLLESGCTKLVINLSETG